MKTIEKAVQSEINIKKSQFICSLFPTKSKKGKQRDHSEVKSPVS